VSYISLHYFLTFYHKWIDFGEEAFEYKMGELIFYETFVWNFSLKEGRAR